MYIQPYAKAEGMEVKYFSDVFKLYIYPLSIQSRSIYSKMIMNSDYIYKMQYIYMSSSGEFYFVVNQLCFGLNAKLGLLYTYIFETFFAQSLDRLIYIYIQPTCE